MSEESASAGTYTRSRLFGFGVDSRDELVRALGAHAGLIISSAARVLGNLADAEDVAQDIAEKLLKAPPSGIQNWPGYLKTLAINKAIDQLRRRKDWEDIESLGNEVDVLVVVDEPESTICAEQRANMLRRAIAKLPERDSQIFSLYYLGDLAHAEIALEMNMSVNAVGVALHRLRARLAADVYASLGLTKGDTVK